jgi:hypothetical protein
MLVLVAATLFADECGLPANATCPRCLDQTGCIYCFANSTCLPSNATCENYVTTRTKECVAQLGGDAKDSVRYAIGFSVLGVALAVDGTVRFVAWRRKRDSYSHL